METAVPAANLFASPVLVNDPLDCIGTPGPNADSGTCADASFDFGGGDTAPSTATVFTGDRRGSDAASVESMDDESLRMDASRVARSIETPEATSRISNNGSTGVFVAPTPSGAGAEDAARVAMAGMDHPTLVNEASNLVAANVRLERERRALVERLEKLQRTKPPSTPTVSRPPPRRPPRTPRRRSRPSRRPACSSPRAEARHPRRRLPRAAARPRANPRWRLPRPAAFRPGTCSGRRLRRRRCPRRSIASRRRRTKPRRSSIPIARTVRRVVGRPLAAAAAAAGRRRVTRGDARSRAAAHARARTQSHGRRG